MKKVYLIRHGLPDFPGGKRMCLGSTDIPLGVVGFAQAEETAKHLPPVTAVFSSPLTRAIQTAQPIGLPVTVIDDLRELDAGEWDGLTFEEIRARYPELYAARGMDPTLPLPGAEADEAGLTRFAAAMTAAAQAAPGDFAVVAHGGIISLFLQSIGCGRYKPGYAEVVSLTWEHNTFYMQEVSL